MPPEATETFIGGDAAAWERLGFARGPDGAFGLGGMRVVVAGEGPMAWRRRGWPPSGPTGSRS